MTKQAPSFDKHPRVDTVTRLPENNIHRVAYDLAVLLGSIKPDPQYPNLTPNPIAVGSFPLFPTQARDLDFEIGGVSWDHLQKQVEIMHDKFENVRLTKGLPNGVIPQDRAKEGYGGNAYVAVWLTLKDGRKANLGIPMLVDQNTNRYDQSTVRYDPELDFKTASKRRSFAHKAVGFSPLKGQFVDPHGGVNSLHTKTLDIVDPDSFRSDPLNIYLAIHEMSALGMKPSETCKLVLREMASGQGVNLDASNLFTPRLNHQRAQLLVGSVKPSITLGHALELEVIKHQIPELGIGLQKKNLWDAAMQNIDSAWERAAKEASFGEHERTIMVLGALLAPIHNMALALKVVDYFNPGITESEQEAFEADTIRSIQSYR